MSPQQRLEWLWGVKQRTTMKREAHYIVADAARRHHLRDVANEMTLRGASLNRRIERAEFLANIRNASPKG